jgi:CPA2 family monovalent cation:H+ antiporter-2
VPHPPTAQGLILFLVVAGIIVPLFHRARIGTVLGFLIAGVALGPGGLGQLDTQYPWIHYFTFNDPHNVEVVAEAGIVVMLFLLGLELSVQRLWQLRRYVLGVGLVQVALTTLAIGFAVRFLIAPAPAGLILGLCLALSSTAIVMQILAEQHRVAHPVGRIALSILLFQDLMVVPILFIVGIFSGSTRGGGWLDLLVPFAVGFSAVAVIMVVGRFLASPLLHSAMRTGSRDLIMAISLLILVVFALVTVASGLSIALGAFLAGILLSDSEVRHQLEIDLEPFKGLLLGIFFIAVGAKVDVISVAGDAGWIVLAVIALMGGKAAVIYGATRAFGVARPLAAEHALLLSQAGEFAFVVVGVATAGKLLSPRLAAGTIAVVGLSMMLTPVAAALARKLASRLESADAARGAALPDAAEFDSHVVIGGFGRAGQLVARVLAAEGVPYVAFDTNGELVAVARLNDGFVFYGDAGRTEMLERVGAERARAFVVTVNHAASAERMVTAAHRIRPDVPVFARARDPRHAERLRSLGAVGVVPENFEASLQLAARVLEKLDVPEDAVSQRLADIREAELGGEAGKAAEAGSAAG